MSSHLVSEAVRIHVCGDSVAQKQSLWATELRVLGRRVMSDLDGEWESGFWANFSDEMNTVNGAARLS
jgi:hypothetical protein